MTTIASFWPALRASPAAPSSRLSRYTIANGVLYLGAGLIVYVAPMSWLSRVFFVEGFPGHEQGLVRVLGVTLAVIGWLYVAGGRTRSSSFALATVVDRALIPFVLLPLAVLHLVPLGIVLPFSILDPVLGLGALLIWRRQLSRRVQGSATQAPTEESRLGGGSSRPT
jgi:hypothetical protein